jgi:hypothetical protein
VSLARPNVTHGVDSGIELEVTATSSLARRAVHDDGSEVKRLLVALETGPEGAASSAAARARQNEGSEATKLRNPGELRLGSLQGIHIRCIVNRH